MKDSILKIRRILSKETSILDKKIKTKRILAKKIAILNLHRLRLRHAEIHIAKTDRNTMQSLHHEASLSNW